MLHKRTYNLLREKRLSLGLNQTELAEKVGVTPALVSLWETGQCWPGPRLIPSLATLFNMTPQSFARELERSRLSPSPA